MNHIVDGLLIIAILYAAVLLLGLVALGVLRLRDVRWRRVHSEEGELPRLPESLSSRDT